MYFTDRTDGHLGVVRPPLALERTGDGLRADVARGTQALAHELEHLIRGPPSNGTCSSPTGRATRATDAGRTSPSASAGPGIVPANGAGAS